MKMALKIVLLVLAVSTLTLTASAQESRYSSEKIIRAVAESPMFQDWLRSNPDYEVDANGPDDSGMWYLDFYNAGREEWIGYAIVNGNTLEITESFAPTPLPPDVYQAQLALVSEYVLNDAEVLARLNNLPRLWDMYPDWNRWDQRWEVAFRRGITGVTVWAQVGENDDVWIADIVDPNALDEEEARQHARDSAINLAYSADGVDAALSGHDDWTTYAEQQGDTVWGVSFVDGDERLVFVLVDVSREQVLDVE
ncbi:MAG TPA: hypothetical protein VER79_07595 [Candidatus Limnocylindrales bacterium]|nr:hypothetical protein [Candidatus Limnocylindrales bacterium]